MDALEASAGGAPWLVLVHIESQGRPCHVNSANLFMVSPELIARPLDQALIVIEAQLNVQGDLAGFFHGKRHSFPEFFPRFHYIPFSSGVIR